MSTMQETPTPTKTRPALTGNDSCDVGDCIAQAYVRVELPNDLDLLFCGHHYHKVEASLVSVALHVQDERHELLPKPYDPATDNS